MQVLFACEAIHDELRSVKRSVMLKSGGPPSVSFEFAERQPQPNTATLSTSQKSIHTHHSTFTRSGWNALM
jgi:hypothetical protein